MSNALRRDWETRVGTTKMHVVLPAHDPDSRVATATPAAPLRTRDHAALVYWDRDELFEAIVPYLAEGIRAGDKVVYVADETPRGALAAALDAAGVDVDAEARRERLTIGTARETFFAGGRFDVEAALKGVADLAASAERDGYRRVRLSVEMTYLLADVPGIERGPELEARANEEIFARFPFVSLCSFNGARDTNDLLQRVLETHPILMSGGIPLANPYYRPWSEGTKSGSARPG